MRPSRKSKGESIHLEVMDRVVKATPVTNGNELAKSSPPLS